MDNFIIVILGVIFFIGRTYMNYKKEQEEASKRNPAAPRTPGEQQPAQQVNRPSERPHDGMPKWLEDLFPPQPQPVQRSPVQREPVPVIEREAKLQHRSIAYERIEYVPTELPADLLKEYRNLPDKKEIEELKRSVAIHRNHNHQFVRLDPFVVADTHESIDVPAFNLREAIIMKAILERPYS